MELVRAMSILRLIVVLEDVTPRVSRTLTVPADLRLDRLHLVLQAAMGWENQHLYIFEAGPHRWSLPEPHLGPGALPVTKATLQDVLAAEGNGPLVYTYDFGDNWRHRLAAGLLG
ncbi:plasmid pRiA4b ORF-3 family protein [Rubellimicrobium rubrum]|uniref:Plasmid pRiA4b ORF-3 family protein n=1 Tax=Rubellimicrobium rubrum TaxID=2585369 RepID=A0A5C4MGQ9_9RHOB|nr:plasmid pRiA4b ORF-3 family protein [Rubellimicrobium rubrum]TNC42507.1 plasmid pRiA4b ORF-3 family protein [Rubellimicrobium rubrum]